MSCWICGRPTPNLSGERECAACRERWLPIPLKETCCLCGYPAQEYLIHPVPLASPPQSAVVCLDCAEDIAALLQQSKPQEQRAAP